MSKNYMLVLLIALFLMHSCEQDPWVEDNGYLCLPSINNTHPDEERFDQFLEEKIKEGLTGISMLIKTPEGLYQGANGVSDIPNRIEMLPCAVHRLGSITKQFTATLILMLEEQGRLDINDKISLYLPSSIISGIPNTMETTIRNLLTHSSGIPDVYDIDFWLEFYNDPTRVRTIEEELQYAKSLNAEFKPGEYIQYSNTNYILLQIIAETITGEPLETLLNQLIFDPLNLENSSFSKIGTRPDNLVRAYTDEFENGYLKDVTNYTFGVSNGTGGIYSNTLDLLHFHEAILKTNFFFDQSKVDEILKIEDIPFFEPGNWTFGSENKVNNVNGFGLGWIELDTDYGKAYGHNGGLMGRKARAWYFPDANSHIVFFINANGGKIDEISRELFRNDMIELIFE